MFGLTRPVIPGGGFWEWASTGISDTVVRPAQTRMRRAITLTNRISNGGWNDRYYVEQRQTIGKWTTELLPQKARRQLRQALIAFMFGPHEDLLDKWPKLLFTPIISRRALGASRVAGASTLE